LGTWQLFVDESGDFEEPGDRGVVAGLLVRGYDVIGTRSRVRSELMETVYPRTTFPPHASTLNIPTSRAAFDMLPELPRANTPEGRDAEGMCAPASKALRRAAAAAVAANGAPEATLLVSRATAATGRWTPPDRENRSAIRGADSWLSSASRPAHSSLVKLAFGQDARMVAFCDAGCSPAFGATECLAVGAWGEVAQEDVDAGDPFAGRMTALFERVVAILKPVAEGATAIVWVHVCERHVKTAGGRRFVVRPTDLRRAAASALRAPVGRARGVVQLVCHPPLAFNEHANPGLALADFVANRLYTRVLKSGSSWDQVVRRAREQIGLPVERRVEWAGTEIRLPTCAADGAHRVAVGRALANGAAAAAGAFTPGRGPRWADEQARAWVEAS
jgi:hypothetical protein